MNLAQTSAFRPFVREFVLPTAIAVRTSYHDVVRGISSAACQRNNMINVVAFTHFLTAPIAFAMLCLILLSNVVSGQSSFSLQFERTAALSLCSFDVWVTSCVFAVIVPSLILVRRIPSALSIDSMLMVSIIVCTVFSIPLMAMTFIRGAEIFLTLLMVGFIVGTCVFRVFFAPIFNLLNTAITTGGSSTISVVLIAMKLVNWKGSPAFFAGFDRGLHSVSPSLFRLFMATGGANDHFSGATLDAMNIISRRRREC